MVYHDRPLVCIVRVLTRLILVEIHILDLQFCTKTCCGHVRFMIRMSFIILPNILLGCILEYTCIYVTSYS